VTANQALKHAEQQMLAARPWERTEPESIWEVTGMYPSGGGFTCCLAMTQPEHMSGQYGPDYRPMFFLIGPALSDQSSKPILPAWIHHARPLVLVHRDEPTRAYYETDQDLLERRP
jgi:hypothetical protein